MKTVIIKYNAGNVRSVEFALARLSVSAIVSDDAEVLCSADRVIFPGVGEAGSAMRYLREKKLDKIICALKQPVLGICLGMQLMCSYSEESDTQCLGIFRQDVKRFPPGNKIPQVGWNRISGLDKDLFTSLNENEYMYFVHGYYAGLSENTISRTNYGFEYSSALKKDNFYGVQFHPERSGKMGERVLENFLKL